MIRADNYSVEQILSNVFGLTIIIYGTIVVYLATKMDYSNEKTQ